MVQPSRGADTDPLLWTTDREGKPLFVVSVDSVLTVLEVAPDEMVQKPVKLDPGVGVGTGVGAGLTIGVGFVVGDDEPGPQWDRARPKPPDVCPDTRSSTPPACGRADDSSGL
jgi:hypothetical protein